MKEINYTDGTIENTLFEILENTPLTQSSADIAVELQKESWPAEYHLSQQRHNLLKHFNFKEKKILEIGAGTGVLSRYIAERCEFLQIIEGTKSRSKSIRARLKDLNNYNIFCGNFSEFKSDIKYDVVLIIGVLEYAELYIQTNSNPFVEFIKLANEYTKINGSIIIAIENRIGLKYWAGASEDHTTNLFDGILGYPLSKSPRTFTKHELEKLLMLGGINSFQFYYPFPDYKLPTTILHESLETESIDLFAALAGNSIARDYSGERNIFFSERVAFEGLKSTKILAEFSNSFLVVTGSNSSILNDENTLAYHYSQNRLEDIVTTFEKVDQNIIVKKRLLNKENNVLDFGYVRWCQPTPSILSIGQPLSQRLDRHINFRDWDLFEKDLMHFFNWIFNKYSTVNNKLDGKAWDLIPQNLIITPDQNYKEIDLEWLLLKEFEKSSFILRSIISFDQYTIKLLRSKYISLYTLYFKLCEKLKIEIINFDNDCSFEVETQSLITKKFASLNIAEEIRIFKVFLISSNTEDIPRSANEFRQHNKMITILKNENKNLKDKLIKSEENLYSIINSKSFKFILLFWNIKNKIKHFFKFKS